MKSYLIIFHDSPFNSSKNLEALEFAMALAAFEQPVSLLFMHDSVLQLLADKQCELISQKDYTKSLTGLDLFGINNLYACAESIQKYNLEFNQLLISPKIINQQQINALLQDYDIVLNI